MVVIKETEFQPRMSKDLAESWAEGIAYFDKKQANNPEWKETPIHQINLSSFGYGLVNVKDESDRSSNPTGTIKDRAAWETVTLYRDFARSLLLNRKIDLPAVAVPRFSCITSGNMGTSVSKAFEQHGLPPIKILVGENLSDKVLSFLKSLYADIYQTDLASKELSSQDIMSATNNASGIDITSVVIIEPNAVFYDWHVYEAFNESPSKIYVPYGTGRLLENYLTHQFRNLRTSDPRLKIAIDKLRDVSVIGVKPDSQFSSANKLTAVYNPFSILHSHDLESAKSLAFTGRDTNINIVSEARINQAYFILSQYLSTCPSGSAGLAGYLQDFDMGKIRSSEKVLVINTGLGI